MGHLVQVVVAKLQQVALQWLQDIGITADNVCATEPTEQTAEVSLEFAIVAMRFGHTMVNDNVGGEATKNTFHCEQIASAGPGAHFCTTLPPHLDVFFFHYVADRQ